MLQQYATKWGLGSALSNQILKLKNYQIENDLSYYLNSLNLH